MLTHAHEDHIGAIPFLLKLRPDIPVVGSKFTLALVARSAANTASSRCSRRSPRARAPPTGCSSVSTSRSTTRFPAAWPSRSTRVRAPCCTPATSSSTSLPPDGRPTDLPGMSRLGDAGVDLFLCDSTNSEIPGVGPSESEIGPNMHRLDPRRGGPRHRGVLRVQRRSCAADHRRLGGARAQGVVRRPVDGPQHGDREGARLSDGRTTTTSSTSARRR